jgi:spermidine synthase
MRIASIRIRPIGSAFGGRGFLYLLFTISGFSGLIYESVWTQYLKLFLGHAAYAQTLVLVLFMGGMAVGAWLPSRYGAHWKNLLLGYAIVEFAVGFFALTFHGVFIRVTDFAYDVLIPAIGTPWMAGVLKWALGAVFILPPSILLGMTFPLMSSGLIRRHTDQPGRSLATLYFSNSIGAAVGVLVSGFVLIDYVGLPGALLTAGLINIGLAIVVWLSVKGVGEPAPKKSARGTGSRTDLMPWRLMLVTSLITGASSFMYEIGWIRMLSLVLGTSTHAFELMLSAFIAGLAFGGLWIRRRIDGSKQPVHFLGWVQIAMGALALTTLLAYNLSFDLMQGFMLAIAPTNNGYGLFNIVSHTLAVFIMVPVTFCAGMTLPLITNVLLKEGYGEKSIGAVYAANTTGAITGIFLAVHIGLPYLGLKGLITASAALDMLLGVALLSTVVGMRKPTVVVALSLTAVAVVYSTFGIELDRYKMASGVYRFGRLFPPNTVEVMYHKDGKTATVNLLQSGDNRSITTNGKPDAQINMRDNTPATPDEVTMTLAGAIPIILHPQARSAANIGMGSGLTTHVMLGGETLERVDTIEIEPAMIEAARGFERRVEAAFTDPRSNFHIDDAKTFFSIRRGRYDIIVSEPSNPWVSGVASLFSEEFYRRIRTHLNPNGLFIQWIQLYEIDVNLVASVLKALGRHFPDYVLYATDNSNLLIVAAKEGKVPALTARGFSTKGLTVPLERIGVKNLQDLHLHQLGDRKLFEPFFNAIPVPLNSDFFPVLDRNAARARFLNSNASELMEIDLAPVPAFEMLGKIPRDVTRIRYIDHGYSIRPRNANIALVVREFYATGVIRDNDVLEPALQQHLVLMHRLTNECRDRTAKLLWLDGTRSVLNALMPHTSAPDMKSIWRKLRSSDCHSRLSPFERKVFDLYEAVGQRNAQKMATLSTELLARDVNVADERRFWLATGMLGYLSQRKPQEARQLWDSYGPALLDSKSSNILLRFLLAHSVSDTVSE